MLIEQIRLFILSFRCHREILTILLLGVFASSINAQDDLNVHGIVSDAITSSKIEMVKVTVKKDGATHDTFTTRANGKYEFYLDCGSSYEFVFEKEGHVKRSLQIDARNVPAEIIGAGIIMPTDMSMYAITPAMKDANLAVFDQPIGKAAYDPAQADLVWDFNYTNKVKAEIVTLMRDIEKRQKELDKEASEAGKEAAAKQAKFDQLVKDGDAAVLKEGYETAVNNYQQALALIPGNAAVETKLANAQTKLTAQNASKEKDAKYNAALDAADSFMQATDYDQAIEKYTEASGIKPSEKYPKDQLAEAKRLKNDREANMAKQEQFDALITQGDDLVAKDDFAAAIIPYQNALKIFPENAEVKRKLDEARNRVKREEEIAAIKQSFDALITQADASFNSEQYELALKAYTDASKLIPENAYAAERIVETQNRIKSKADAAANQQAFDAAIKKGDDAIVNMTYRSAETFYKTALELIPNDKTAESKLAEAQRLATEQESAAENKAKYDALVSEADRLFETDKLPEAKEKYTEARTLMPEITYPIDQINKIEGLIAQRADAEAAEKAFSDAMEAGQAAVDSQNYNEAVSQFGSAVGLKPKDKNAKDALANAENLKREFDSNQAVSLQYQSFIDEADRQLASDNLALAKSNYESALGVKQGETYPQDQLVLIAELIQIREQEAAEKADQAARDTQFNTLVSEGDVKRGSKQFDVAIQKYQAALILKPEDSEVRAKLADTEQEYQNAQEAADLDTRYAAFISQADADYQAKNWDNASDGYTAALQLKANEKYPKDQIALIAEQKEKEQAAREAAENEIKLAEITALLVEGDKLVSDTKFEKGIDKYNEALSLSPERSDIQAKIDAANIALLALLESNANNEAFADAIKSADKAFKKEEWEAAKADYELASSLKPGETYPKTQLELIEQTLSAIAASEALAKNLKKEAALKKLIDDGDSKFSKNRFEEARTSYEEALVLMPDSEIAMERLLKVQAELDKLDAGRANKDRYDAIINAADQLYKNESLEMARLKYMDALEILPNEKYPADRITEIDLNLERMRLAEMAKGEAEIEAAYREAVARGDDSQLNQSYDEAIAAYMEAGEIKPDEIYPKAQIERIQLLITERETAELERERLAQAKRDAELNRKRLSEDQSSVNTDSERQAEQFMREARLAQERERYERIKKEKAEYELLYESLIGASEQNRIDSDRSLDYYRFNHSEQFDEAVRNMEANRKASMKNKESLSNDQQRFLETNQIRKRENYAEVMVQAQLQQELNQTKSLEQMARISRERQVYERQMEEMRQAMKRENRANYAEFQKNNQDEASRAAYLARLEAQRSENAKNINDEKAQTMKSVRERNQQNEMALRAKSVESKENAMAIMAAQSSKNSERIAENAQEMNKQREGQNSDLSQKAQMADERRKEFRQKHGEVSLGEPKAYTDYYRTELADHYPQGVTEESSTLGNKVIITRIVVRGNRGDEFKKVVDKAGNYYFKNGRSISEYTWNRETIQEFKKQKD